MELRIQPSPGNGYPIKGLLIRGASPQVWLREIESLGIGIRMVRSFPVPAGEPNVLYGCFLVFRNTVPPETGKNILFQSVDDRLFIPEYTTFYPKVNPEEWDGTDAGFLLMHPDFGLVKLKEETGWLSVIQDPPALSAEIRKPSAGVKIPDAIKSYTVEMDDEKVMEDLQHPETEQEWMNSLPFDLKKVMAGNQKEIEKYLKYIEKYPERAIDLGIPLDITGTSRGNGFGKLIFDMPWFGKLYGGNADRNTSSSYTEKYRWVFWGFLMVLGLVRLIVSFNREEAAPVETRSSGNLSQKPDEEMMTPVVAYQSGVTDIDLKIDSMYGRERKDLLKEQMAASLKSGGKNEKSYEEYLKSGGRPIDEIRTDIARLNDKTDAATDSLKRVYRRKIVKYLVQNEAAFRKKVTDSLRKAGTGKPADEGIVRKALQKKQLLVEDSLGRLYGTKADPEPPAALPEKALKTGNGENPGSGYPVSFSEVFWLIVAMIGITGLYIFVVKRKSLNAGGAQVPAGTKIFLIAVLIAMIAYIFYPLIGMFGYNWFVWMLIIGVLLLLYRLFSEDKTILKSDKDE